MSDEIKLARFDVPNGFDYLVERYVDGDYYRASEVDATVAELRAELERVRGDAERFVYVVDEGVPTLCLAVHGAPCYTLERARAVIDASRAHKEPV